MWNFLIFAFCVIRVTRSNPQETSLQDFEVPLPNHSELNNASSNCSFSGPRPQNQPEIQNFHPPDFVLKCKYVAKKAMRDDYHYAPGLGFYKFHTRAQRWNLARKICNEEGGHLAIINSFAEAKVLTDLLERSGPIKGGINQIQGLLGIHDLYTEGDWVTVHGDSLAKTGYSTWSDKWGGQPDNGSGMQNCGAMVNDSKLDDVNCNAPYAFFCEIPL